MEKTKYRKKPVVIEAYQWFEVSPYVEGEKRDVDYWRHPNVSGDESCKYCSKTMHVHGWVDTLEGGHTVCPGDFVITGVQGEFYPCKPDIFEATYERLDPLQGSIVRLGLLETCFVLSLRISNYGY